MAAVLGEEVSKVESDLCAGHTSTCIWMMMSLTRMPKNILEPPCFLSFNHILKQFIGLRQGLRTKSISL